MNVKGPILAALGGVAIGLVTQLAGLGLPHSEARSLAQKSVGLQIQTTTNPLIAKGVATVPVKDLVSQLKSQTKVPILIPSQIPTSQKLYFSGQGTADGYTISIGYTPNCQAGACSFGEIRAEKGGSFSEKVQGVTKTLKTIPLAKGTNGSFHNGCGAYCTATVEWKSQGVLYSVAVKNGREADTIAIANSAIQGGPR